MWGVGVGCKHLVLCPVEVILIDFQLQYNMKSDYFDRLKKKIIFFYIVRHYNQLLVYKELQ